jgi:hypothetical protein
MPIPAAVWLQIGLIAGALGKEMSDGGYTIDT